MGIFSKLFRPDIDKLREDEDIDGLIKALDYKKANDIRKKAIDALGYLGESKAVEPLIENLRDEDTTIREKAAAALRQIEDGKTITSLKKATKDKDLNTYATGILINIANDWTAVFIANEVNTRDGRCGKGITLCGEIGELAVEPLMKAFTHRYEGTLYYARKAMIKIGEPAIKGLISAVADKDRNSWVRMESAGILAEMGDKRAVEPLIHILKDKDTSVLSAAVRALGEIGDTKAIAPLIKLLDDENSAIRQSAAEALEKIGESSVEFIVESIKNKEHINKETITLLRNLGVEDEIRVKQQINHSIESLIQALKNTDNTIREETAEALGEIGDKRAVEPLIQALEDKNAAVQRAAFEALGKIGDKKAVEVCIKALHNPESRIMAASALGQLGDEQAIQPLEEVLEDPLTGYDPFSFVDDVEGKMQEEKKIRGVIKKAIMKIKNG